MDAINTFLRWQAKISYTGENFKIKSRVVSALDISLHFLHGCSKKRLKKWERVMIHYRRCNISCSLPIPFVNTGVILCMYVVCIHFMNEMRGIIWLSHSLNKITSYVLSIHCIVPIPLIGLIAYCCSLWFRLRPRIVSLELGQDIKVVAFTKIWC